MYVYIYSIGKILSLDRIMGGFNFPLCFYTYPNFLKRIYVIVFIFNFIIVKM